tara:strand:+ start:296 stop:661 length:366 start_codon:yes stop_codon:yes gene_type:complete
MKITKRQLRRIIQEALNEAKTVPSRWWEYDPQDVVTDIYHQRRQLPPKDWKDHWDDIKMKLEEKWPRPEHLAGETYQSGYDDRLNHRDPANPNDEEYMQGFHDAEGELAPMPDEGIRRRGW